MGHTYEPTEKAEEAGTGKNFTQKNPAQETAEWGVEGAVFLGEGAGGFEELSVFDACGAGGFAGETAEAVVHLFGEGAGGFDFAVKDTLHEIESPAGAMAFVLGEVVGGAGG